MEAAPQQQSATRTTNTSTEKFQEGSPQAKRQRRRYNPSQAKNSQHRQDEQKRQRRRPHSFKNNSNNKNNKGNPLASILSCCICNTTKSVNYKCPKCRAPYCSVACNKQHRDLCSGPVQSETTKKSSSKYGCTSTLPKPSSENQNLFKSQTEQDDDDDDEPEGWKLTNDMTNALDRSSWLQNELQDGGLRHLIATVVAADPQTQFSRNNSNFFPKSSRRRKYGKNYPRQHNDNTNSGSSTVLEQLTNEYPEFQIFLDKLLVLAGVLERQNEDCESPTSIRTQNKSNGTSKDASSLETWLEQPHSIQELQQCLVLKPIPRKTRPVADATSMIDQTWSGEGSSSSSDEESNEKLNKGDHGTTSSSSNDSSVENDSGDEEGSESE